MTKCVFCGKEQAPHKGMFMIKNSGTMDYYCSGKCRANSMKLKRDKRRLKWTEAYRISRAKEVASAEKKKNK